MEPGELFRDRFRIVGPLGTGGQSRVWRADDEETGRRVAIKVLHDSGDSVRFIREGRVISRLDSMHTVKLFEFGQEDGTFFMVCEFIAGDDLGKIVRRGESPMAWTRVANLMRGVLESLAEAHELGIVHRDIKPSNIMVAPGEIAKVLDFGVARMDRGEANALTAKGEVLGTPRYVSPESLSGGEVTAATDVYSVGLVAWELLVGRPANDARNGADIVLRHLDPTPYRLPTELELPDEARRWVTSLCNKNPERRPKDAAEALAELVEFAGEPTPFVSQRDESTYDDSLDSVETGVLPVDDDDEYDDPAPEAAPSREVDTTDPDPWKPAADPTEPSAWIPPDVAATQPNAVEPAPPPPQPASPGRPQTDRAPPPQPPSKGLPESMRQKQRAVPSHEPSSPPRRTSMVLLVVVTVLAIYVVLSLMFAVVD